MQATGCWEGNTEPAGTCGPDLRTGDDLVTAKYVAMVANQRSSHGCSRSSIRLQPRALSPSLHTTPSNTTHHVQDRTVVGRAEGLLDNPHTHYHCSKGTVLRMDAVQ